MRKNYTLREDTWGGELASGQSLKPSRTNSTKAMITGSAWAARWRARPSGCACTTIDGNPADTNYWQHEASDGSYAAAEIICQHTGTYFIVVSLEKGSRGTRVPWGVVYAYR